MPRILALLAVVLCLHAGEAEAAPKLPATAQAVVDRLAKAEAKIEADAVRLRSAERQKAIKELEKAQQAVTKAGDLAGALAIKGRIEELKKAEDADTAAILGDDKPATRDPARLAVGTWSATKTNGVTAQVELKDDKSVKATWGPIVIAGTWLIEKERIVIRWNGDSAKWENLAVEGPDKLAGDSHDAGKDGISMVRVKK